MRKDRFVGGLYIIMAAVVASHSSGFRFHGGILGNGAEKEQMTKDLQLPLLRHLTNNLCCG